MRKILVLFAAFFVIVYFLGYVAGNQALMLVSKPLPVLLLAFALLPWTRRYQRLIAIAFIFSAFGDLFLQLPGDYFMHGLTAFLIAHLFFILAFWYRSKRPELVALLVLIIFGIVEFELLKSGLKNMKLPVIVYMTVILTMLWRAYAQRNFNSAAKFAFFGALAFVLSDSVIAFNRFCCDILGAQVIIMILYWSAQWLIFYSAYKTVH